uniref:Uncharacterized protein n=1 Tax=viral metagenome TaxID=1070528 RepID=A0A6C0HVG0_9ZZZZ
MAARQISRPSFLFPLEKFNIPSKSIEDEGKEKILTLNIPEEVIIRIADEIKKSTPSPTINGISLADFNKLTPEDQTKNILPIVISQADKLKLDPKKPYKSGVIILDSDDPYHIVFKKIDDLLFSLKYMKDHDTKKLYDIISTEQDLTKPPPNIEYYIVQSPLSTRLIAHVSSLNWNGVDLLNGDPIMLYQSKGISRETGLGGYWLPYLGERYGGNVAKLEDEYIRAIDCIIESPQNFSPDDKAHYTPILIDILNNIVSYDYYKRFINRKYLIASFLLFSEFKNYMDSPSNQEHIRKYIRNYNDDETDTAQGNIRKKIEIVQQTNRRIDYIPITAEIIDEIIKPDQQEGSGSKYYMKYLKYKMKYIQLKH